MLALLVENNISDGASLIVQGRLRVDSYTNNKGARATSHRVIAQRLRLDTKVDVGILSVNAVENNSEVMAVDLIRCLRSSNMLEDENQVMEQLTRNQRTVLATLNHCFMVTNSGASLTDLLTRLEPLVERIASRDQTVRVEEVVSLLPDVVTRSQASTLLEEVMPEPDSQPSTRPQLRQQYGSDMED